MKDKELWDIRRCRHVPVPPRVQAFLDAIEEVCKKHKLGIGHEDGHGCFEVCDYDNNGFPGSPHLDLRKGT